VFSSPIDTARLAALRRLNVPGAVLPIEPLTDDQGHTVGHTMRFVQDATPLSRLLSRRYCDENGFDASARLAIVRQLADLVHSAHRANALVVDLHEGNILLDASRAPILIDCSSWQLPGFPATALQDTVRDRHATGFDQGSDWFAFAVTALQLLLGIHPYRGTHPHIKGLDDRMFARVSVLHPDVRVPPVCPPVDGIPTRWRRWFEAVLHGDVRCAPPSGGVDAVPWTPQLDLRTTRLHATVVQQCPHAIADAVEAHGVLFLRGPHGVFVDHWQPMPVDAIAISSYGSPIAAHIVAGRLHLLNAHTQQPIATSMHADQVARLGSGFVVRSGARLVYLDVHAGHALPKLLAAVLPNATTLHDGVAVQNLLGACHLLLLGAGRCDTRRVPELDGWTILHAQHHAGVAVVVARRAGRTDRFLLRFGHHHHELRRTEDVDTADVDLVVLPSGVATLRIGTRVELFRTQPGHPDLRVLEDPILASGHLVALSGALGLVQARQVLRIQARPTDPGSPCSPSPSPPEGRSAVHPRIGLGS
jgi:hypothetical protein